MKIYQIFFSPTGGVRKAADLFCRGLGLLCEPIDLMRHVGPLDFSPEDLCVIAVPVYGGRVPAPALKALAARCRHLVMVTNDVFSDGIDYAQSTQDYLRGLAAVNRQAAEMADAVVEVVCSIPVCVKGELPCV